MPHFNLLADPWIPVRDLENRLLHVSLKDALLHAHQFLRVEDPSPLAEAAFHRLLLAVCHRALGGPTRFEEAVELLAQGHLPDTPLEDYLRRFSDRFELFHPEYPFYQVPDLPADSPLPWTKLLPELASGHNPTLFDHTTDAAPPAAAPGRVLRALLVHQSFTPGGLIRRLGVTSGKGGPLATAAVFIPFGETLFETLVFNMPPYNPVGDSALWERQPYHTRDVERHRTQEASHGRARVYTWLSRSIRLLPEPDGSVRYIAYGPGILPIQDPFEPDPMCAYFTDDAGQPRPVRLGRERAFWRDFDALLPDEGRIVPRVLEQTRGLLLEKDRVAFVFPLSVLGQITDQAKVLTTRREVYPLPLHALDLDVAVAIRRAVTIADESARQLSAAGWSLARALLAPGGREPLAEDVGQVMQSLPLMRVYWSNLEAGFSAYLDDVARTGAANAYSGWVQRITTAVLLAWEYSTRAVGKQSRQLTAIETGERRLAVVLAALKKEVIG